MKSYPWPYHHSHPHHLTLLPSFNFCDSCLQENAMNYDKGVLAEILEPIMGKGLIPADLETWKVRGASGLM